MMFSRIRRRITYTNVAMTLALVFAMTGGAYAAKKYLITSTKQISPKVLKQLKGAKGPVGERGPQGQAGEKGANGANGTNGKDGANGKDGVSVTSKELTSKDAACKKEGGSEFTAATGNTVACNGSPWTAGGTLPIGSSETGEWAIVYSSSGFTAGGTAISFTIPLAKAISEGHAHLIKPGEGAGEPKEKLPVGCSGNWAEPKAASGNLCVFAEELSDAEESKLVGGPLEGVTPEGSGKVGADKWGAQMILLAPNAEVSRARGTWVVTG